ncbi:uncharacterized protein LY89DRAFT_672237 [Mollisia scopiformis]|uniref:Uncharacterized protein n=1 Tax=Mollisia scopiformis TaxID=149040 RepID=A0A194X192_MOLSC|nr:uncharacterized protein LY89DRAFT_672237 [Mollisia scopiformis]KUJ13966.1 hypothetical protein LY89DRAFT_672237 [Mollisia scopiformis]
MSRPEIEDLQCDFATPACSPCIRAQKLCSGYRDTRQLRVRDQSQDVRRRVISKLSPSPPHLHSLSQALHVQARESFFLHYVTGTLKTWDFLEKYSDSTDIPPYLASALMLGTAEVRILGRLSTNHLISSVASNLAVPMDLQEVRAYCGEHLNVVDPKWRLSDLMVSYANLRSQIRGAYSSSINSTEKLWDNQVDQYPSRHVTQTWNVCRLIRILLNESILKYSGELERKTTTTNGVAPRQTLRDNVEMLAKEICSSARQYTDCRDKSNLMKSGIQTTLPHTHNPAEKLDCYTTIFPLYIAGQSKCTQQRRRDEGSQVAQDKIRNLMFASSATESETIHAAVDPHLSLPLATVYSPTLPKATTHPAQYKATMGAQRHFEAWTKSFRVQASQNLTLGFFTGDAIAFRHALQYRQFNTHGSSNWYRTRHVMEPFNFDHNGEGWL